MCGHLDYFGTVYTVVFSTYVPHIQPSYGLLVTLYPSSHCLFVWPPLPFLLLPVRLAPFTIPPFAYSFDPLTPIFTVYLFGPLIPIFTVYL